MVLAPTGVTKTRQLARIFGPQFQRLEEFVGARKELRDCRGFACAGVGRRKLSTTMLASNRLAQVGDTNLKTPSTSRAIHEKATVCRHLINLRSSINRNALAEFEHNRPHYQSQEVTVSSHQFAGVDIRLQELVRHSGT